MDTSKNKETGLLSCRRTHTFKKSADATARFSANLANIKDIDAIPTLEQIEDLGEGVTVWK